MHYVINCPTCHYWLRSGFSESAGRSSWSSVSKSINVIVENYYFVSETGSLNKYFEIIRFI